MTISEYLSSLTESERDFIAGLDYGNDFHEHRHQLELVIDRSGDVDMDSQLWYPYEVIELGKNWLQEHHEREFVACAAIVLHNFIRGADRKDAEISMSAVTDEFLKLSREHQEFLEPLLKSANTIA